MRAGPTRRHAPVLRVQPPKGDQRIGVACEQLPIGCGMGNGGEITQYMRQQRLRCTPAVISDLIREPASGGKKAPELRARMMIAPGAGPAIGATKDRLRPAGSVDPLQLGGGEIEGGLPVDGYHLVPPAPVATDLRPLFKPGPPDMRAQNPGLAMDKLRPGADHLRIGAAARNRTGRD